VGGSCIKLLVTQIKGRFKMGGAQPPEAFTELFEEIAQEQPDA
jgi:hypothetical protein